jgi:hypothetical protein
VVEVFSMEILSSEEKWNIASVYGPYLLLAVGMGVDMFYRVKSSLLLEGKVVKKD